MSPTVETVAIAAGPREQEALDEMARTRLGRPQAIALVAFLLFLLSAGASLELRRHLQGQPTVFPGEPRIPGPRRFAAMVRAAGWLRTNDVLTAALHALEDRMGRFSAVSAALRPGAQWHLAHDLRYGNSQVVVGRDGALEYQTAFSHLTGRPFLDRRALERRRVTSGKSPIEPDPLPGLVQLGQDLSRRGVRLLFLPVPVKTQIHPEPFLRRGVDPPGLLANPSTAELLSRLETAGIATYDPTEELRAAARAGETLYFTTDTHWNHRGMVIAARGLARRLRELGLVEERPPAGLERHPFVHEYTGDMVKLLGLGPFEGRVPREKANVFAVRGLGGVDYRALRPEGDVLLLGDSYSVVFSFDGAGAAGFSEQLGYELDRPVRKYAVTAPNELADRVRWLRQNPALLDGVHTVVYEVTARALSSSNWLPEKLDRPRAEETEKALSEIDLRFPVGPSPEIERMTPAMRERTIDDIAACPTHLQRAIAGLDDAKLDTPYRDGGWTVRQVVHHVADSHMNAYIRHKLAVTEDLPTIKPYHEELWAELADGKEVDPQVSVVLLQRLHVRWVRYLRSLAPEQFERRFVHPAMKAPVTLDGSVAMYAWHGRHHVAHIDGLRKRMGW